MRKNKMAKNHMKEVARMFGVEVGEEFKLKGSDDIYRFSEDSILEWKSHRGFKEENTRVFLDLIVGEEEIER